MKQTILIPVFGVYSLYELFHVFLQGKYVCAFNTESFIFSNVCVQEECAGIGEWVYSVRVHACVEVVQCCKHRWSLFTCLISLGRYGHIDLMCEQHRGRSARVYACVCVCVCLCFHGSDSLRPCLTANKRVPVINLDRPNVVATAETC